MKTFVWIVVGLVILVGGWLLLRSKSDQLVQQSPTPSPVTTVQQNEGVGPDDTQLQATTPSQPTRAYTQLVAGYAGKRIQFGISCQAVPANVSFKNGTTLMFDNRSGDPRTITIDGTTYSFPGYGYKIITLSKTTVPYTVKLNCGSAVNVGQIILQK